MFWKQKQNTMTPLEEIVLAKMNLFLKSLMIIFIDQKEEVKNFAIERHITDVIGKNQIWKISSDGWEIIVKRSDAFKSKDIILSFNGYNIDFHYYNKLNSDLHFNILCEKLDHLFFLNAKYKGSELLKSFYDLTDRTDKIASGKKDLLI